MNNHARRWLYRWETLAILSAATAMVIATLVGAWAVKNRSDQVDDVLFHQCITNETQDTVIVQLITSEKWRVKATFPVDSPIRARLLQTLNDAILTLEPPDEKDCY